MPFEQKVEKVTTSPLSLSTISAANPLCGNYTYLSLLPLLGWDEELEPASLGEQVLALPCKYLPRFSASKEQLEGLGVVPQLDSEMRLS